MSKFNYLLLLILLFINYFASTAGVIAQVLTVSPPSDLKSINWAVQSFPNTTLGDIRPNIGRLESHFKIYLLKTIWQELV